MKGPVDELIESLPECNRNIVHVHWVQNIGPYRKLIPMLREADDGNVILTADDDIFYGRDWLNSLLEAFKEAGGRPVAARVRAKKANPLGKKTSYVNWSVIKTSAVMRDDFIITFGGGAVLTRAMFREDDISDDAFLDVAPTADDLWYSKLLERNNNEVVVVPSLLNELNFIQHGDGLTNHNLPRASSVLHKIRTHIFDKLFGFLGLAVSGNDVASRKIERYFSGRE